MGHINIMNTSFHEGSHQRKIDNHPRKTWDLGLKVLETPAAVAELLLM